jgi:NAD(P)H-flavin reductase
LPILFKKYKDGAFTSLLVKECYHIYPLLLLNGPLGQGLQLSSVKPGKIIVVTGGTGLYPFSDLIDLLFKELLVKIKP